MTLTIAMLPSPSKELALAPPSEAGTDIAASQLRNLSTPTPFGALSIAPPEIRLQIYHHLVAAGSVHFLATCKNIHREAIGVLYREGVYRLNFNPSTPHCYKRPSKKSLNAISNLEIRLDLVDMIANYRTLKFNRSRNRPHDPEVFNEPLDNWLPGSSDWHDKPSSHPGPREHPSQPRRSCKIVLNVELSYGQYWQVFFINVIRRLIEVETLVFTLILGDGPEMSNSLSDPSPDSQRNTNESLRRSKKNEDTLLLYKSARRTLEPTLGPAELVRDQNGEYFEAQLKFRPRAFLS